MSSSKNKGQGDSSPSEKTEKKQQPPPNAWDWLGATQIELMQSNISELPQSPDCPRLKVLYLQGNANLIEIPTLFFQHMPLLQNLDLSYTGIQGLPSSMFKLAQLKTLYLRGCEHFTQLPPDIVQLKNLEKLDLDGTPITHLPPSLNFPKMKSLLLGGNPDLMEMPASFFDHMPLISILDLSRTSIHELPSSFFNLQELREFYLKDCELFMELPPEIGRLITLKKLNLDGSQITHLPNDIRELTNLESLSLSFSEYHHNSDHGKKCLPHSKFAMIPLGIISNLTHLEDLRIDVDPDNEWWHDNVEHILAEINGLEKLRTLDLYVPKVKFLKLIPRCVFYFRFIVGHHMQRIISRAPVAVEVKFKQSNRSLRFVNGMEIPNEVKNILQYAEVFFLDRHMTIKHLFQFELKNLRQLQSCILAECNEMQSIVDGDVEDSCQCWFSSLEFLTIFYMKNLRSIVQGPPPPECSFSRLKLLALHTCSELTTIFTMHFLDNLLNLEELIVEDCPKVSSIINCHSSEPRAGIFLPRLRKLSLLYLPALVCISNGLHIGESLETIGFYYCPNVQSLSSAELSSKKLKVIRGEIKWWEALKWSEREWGQNVRPSYLSCIFFPINEEDDVLTQLTSNSNEERDSDPTHVCSLQELHTHNPVDHFSLARSPPQRNEGSNFSLNKLERPPLKTLTIPTSSLSTDRNVDLRVSVDDGSPASNDGDLYEQWKHPSFFSTTRRRASVKPAKTEKVEFSNLMGGKLDGDRNKVGSSSAIPAPRTNSSSSSSTWAVTIPTHSSTRRPQQNKHSSIWYSLSVTCAIIACLSYLLYKHAKMEGKKITMGCENDNCYKNGRGSLEKGDGSFSNILNTDSGKVALYILVSTLILPFLIYKYLDYLPQIINFVRGTKNKEDVPLTKRIAYRIDVFFSMYPYAKLLALLCATLFLIAFRGLALYAVTGVSFAEALWHSWTYVADSGNHAETEGTAWMVVSIFISSGTLLIFAMMLSLVSDAISEKVDSLKKGKSEVYETNHILILGWSNKLGSLVKQLAIAHKSFGGGVIVVLAEKVKEEMEMDIANLEFDFMGTSVICRNGSPLILADLKKVSVSKARAIIVLASDENVDESDARALRVVLSLTGIKKGLKGHVVVEMSDLDNEPLVKLVGGDLIETVVAHDVIGRLMIQCALQPGLAQIWEGVLGFENAEFYIKRWPELDGLCFKDVLISFPDAIPCGIKVAADGGKIIINPDDNYVLRGGDEVLVIADDRDTYAPGPLPEVHKSLFPRMPDPPKYPEKILFCGWRRDIDDMIMVLEAFLAPGSELWMFNEVSEKEREKKLIDGGLDVSGLVNIKLVHREGNTVVRRHLESLPLETFDSILILADESAEDSVVHSDSRSLATLLLIRDIQSKRLPYKDSKSTTLRLSGYSHGSWIREMQQASDKSIIISEILDSRTRNLVSVSRISDYVLSNELVSMALAMVAEDKQINRVLEELFAEEGNEMCIKPAEFYLFDQEELCFYDIMIRGRQRSEIVIGYRIANQERAIINPPEKSLPRKWSLDDVFVVIASGD